MDYEGELALVALGAIDDDALAPATPQPFGLAAANDLTARIVPGARRGPAEPLRLLGRARSRSRASCRSPPRVWAPRRRHRDDARADDRDARQRRAPPAGVDEDADLRPRRRSCARPQRAPRRARSRAATSILTGTPAGVGLRLSPLKRRDRGAAQGSPAQGRAARRRLRDVERRCSAPGDVIEVDGRARRQVRARLVV